MSLTVPGPSNARLDSNVNDQGNSGLSLSDLLEQSKRLTTYLARSDLPQVELGLDQIESQSRRLLNKQRPEEKGEEARA
jgi:hypothetical protein